MGKLRQSTEKIQELLDIVEQGGGTGSGLQYAVERTVYPTRAEWEEDEPEEVEISEEERKYNIETVMKAAEEGNVFIAFAGMFLSCVFSVNNTESGYAYAKFNSVYEIEETLVSVSTAITSNGDAVLTVRVIKTGGGSIDPELLEGYMPLQRQFSDDFNNDFAR